MRFHYIFDDIVEVGHSDYSKVKFVDLGDELFEVAFEVAEYRFHGWFDDYLLLWINEHFEIDFLFSCVIEEYLFLFGEVVWLRDVQCFHRLQDVFSVNFILFYKLIDECLDVLY